MEFKEFKKVAHSLRLDAGDFSISYIPPFSNPWKGTGFDGDLPSGEEIALIKDKKYYILNGDFRKEYLALAPLGFDACMKFFLENVAEHGSTWSDEPEN